jgi:hypothetical protein
MFLYQFIFSKIKIWTYMQKKKICIQILWTKIRWHILFPWSRIHSLKKNFLYLNLHSSYYHDVFMCVCVFVSVCMIFTRRIIPITYKIIKIKDRKCCLIGNSKIIIFKQWSWKLRYTDKNLWIFVAFIRFWPKSNFCFHRNLQNYNRRNLEFSLYAIDNIIYYYILYYINIIYFFCYI